MIYYDGFEDQNNIPEIKRTNQMKVMQRISDDQVA